MKRVVSLLIFVLSISSYRNGCMGAVPEGMVKAPACERHHVVMDPVNETLWTFSPYRLRRHELRLLNPQDNVELLIPGQMLCVKALETGENYRPHLEYRNYMENWSRVVSIAVTAHGTNETKYCTGIVLDERTVITTASCTSKTLAESVQVVLRHSSEFREISHGDWGHVSVPPITANVEKIAVHPEYFPESGQSHNVAVLFLKEKTKLDSTARKLELPEQGVENTDSTKETYVVQWNYFAQRYVMENGTEGVNKSRTVMDLEINKGLVLVEPSQCREMFWAQGYDDFYLSDDMLCTVMDPDEYLHDVCHEGNGAALVLFDEGLDKYSIIGIGVATSGDCTDMKRGHDYIFVDLRPKSNLEWLRKTIQL